MFFRRVLAMSLSDTISIVIKRHILSFIINAFQSLDIPIVRKLCAPLVSIGLWHYLNSEQARLCQLQAQPQNAKVWRAMVKRFVAADDRTKVKIQFEQSWLPSMILNFVRILNTATQIETCTYRREL